MAPIGSITTPSRLAVVIGSFKGARAGNVDYGECRTNMSAPGVLKA
jgi:hypothetical protein